jgi:serine carboxypeptidase 1
MDFTSRFYSHLGSISLCHGFITNQDLLILFRKSLVDESGMVAVMSAALKSAEALARGDGRKATELWSSTESVVNDVTDGVNVYNILKWNGDTKRIFSQSSNVDLLERMFNLHVGLTQNDALYDLMNGPIRKKLGIIPDNVTWSGQSEKVFYHQSEDFMKPVVDIVDGLLNSTNLEVTVYTGQLDLIVDTLGTERWVQKLTWSGLPMFNSTNRSPFFVPTQPYYVAGYVKSYKKFSFYWILDAGHMIPSDAPDAALLMLKKVIHVK